MVEITGDPVCRKYAGEVADWCARELAKARETGDLETRPFVQNADLIIAALREYASSTRALAGAVTTGPYLADIKKTLNG